MKKIKFLSKSILFVVMFFLVTQSFANSYYISSTGDDTKQGTEAAPWASLSKISTIASGDDVYLKRGDVWYDKITNIPSGSTSNYTKIGAYGAVSIARPIVDTRCSDSLGTWTSRGTNLYSATLTYAPKRVWLSESNSRENVSAYDEYSEAPDLDSVNSTLRWFYDAGTDRLYVWSEGVPPNSKYSYILYLKDRPIIINDDEYITVQSIEFRGGLYSAIAIQGSNDIEIKFCWIGYGKSGLAITPIGSDISEDIKITSNVFNSKYLCDDPWDEGTNKGNGDGISILQGVKNCTIENNDFKSWGHAGVQLSSLEDNDYGVHDIKILKNTFNFDNVYYGRAFGVSGIDGKVYNNTFYLNIIDYQRTRSQIAGNYNVVSYNLFRNCKYKNNRPIETDKSFNYTCQVLASETNIYDGKTIVSKNNTFAYNIFYHSADSGVSVRVCKNASNLLDLTIRQNVFFECGESPNPYAGASRIDEQDLSLMIRTDNQAPTGDFKVKATRNIIFSSNKTDTIFLGREDDIPQDWYTPVGFNAVYTYDGITLTTTENKELDPSTVSGWGAIIASTKGTLTQQQIDDFIDDCL
jgi:hypothetical protein